MGGETNRTIELIIHKHSNREHFKNVSHLLKKQVRRMAEQEEKAFNDFLPQRLLNELSSAVLGVALFHGTDIVI